MLCPFDLLKENDSVDMVKELLLDMAIIKSGGKPIFPVGDKKSLADCFTVGSKNELILWYDDGDGSTHAVSQSKDVGELFKKETK